MNNKIVEEKTLLFLDLRLSKTVIGFFFNFSFSMILKISFLIHGAMLQPDYQETT